MTTLQDGLFGGLTIVADELLFGGEEGLTRLPLAGADPAVAAQSSAESGLWVLGEQVYFTGQEAVGAIDAQGKQSSGPALFSRPLAGGESVKVYEGFLSHGISDGESLFFVGQGGLVRIAPPAAPVLIPIDNPKWSITSLAAAGDHVYGTILDYSSVDYAAGNSYTTGGIIRVPKAGGAVDLLLANISHAWSLVADESGLYWSAEPPAGQYGNGHIAHASLDGSQAGTFLDSSNASALASDADYLYLATEVLRAYPKAGGDPITLATGLEGADFLTVSAGNVLWVNLAQRAKSETRTMSLRLTCAPGATGR